MLLTKAFFVALFACTLEWGVSVKCPKGWTQFNNLCYLYMENRVTFHQAVHICYFEHNFAYLAAPQTEEENDRLNEFTKQDYYQHDIWLGGQRGNNVTTEDIDWLWEMGPYYVDIPITYYSWWKPYEPDNEDGNENCILSYDTSWYDSYCENHHYFVCEMGKDRTISDHY